MNFVDLISMLIFIVSLSAKTITNKYITRKSNISNVTPVILKSYKNEKLLSKFYKYIFAKNLLTQLGNTSFKIKSITAFSVATEILDDS